jgi:hypothetical protein
LDEVTVLGTVLGALIVTVIITRMTAGYAACAVIVVLTAAAFAWRNLAPMVAPLAAGVVLGLMNSYPALFALAGLVTVMGGGTAGRVRSVP